MFDGSTSAVHDPLDSGSTLSAMSRRSEAFSAPVLLDLYRQMYRIRIVEEHIAMLYPERQMRCPVHLCIGQEAIPVGISAHLQKTDYVLSSHRSHGHYLAQGGDLRRMMAELYGKETGCTGGKGGSMHLVDRSVGFLGATPIVASSIPIAVGVAFGTVLQNDHRVTVVYFGDAATEEGVFHESLNFAALKNLPVLFVCENNGYSVYSSLSVRRKPGQQLAELARVYGIPSLQIDGNNVLDVYDAARAAIGRARDGLGPTFVECFTYRWREHCGPNYDDDLGYRGPSEFARWRSRCPIRRLEACLLDRQMLTERRIHDLRQALLAEVHEAVAFARCSPFPSPAGMQQHVFAPGRIHPRERAA